jgi:radical SAM superfamily enzyme YgiQ (UPF0313 family)
MTNTSYSFKSLSPKIVLLYPPNQSWPGTMCKPNGSLAYPSLAGALIGHDIEVEIFDACVGNDRDSIEEVFFKPGTLPNGLLRTGVSNERILEEVADADIVGLTSIFTDQEAMVLLTSEIIKKKYPDKLLIAGGVNARSRLEVFLANGIDIVCLSEAEKTIIKIVEAFREKDRDFSHISSIAFKRNGEIIVNRTKKDDIVWDLDKLPIPAWHLLPNERYWEIGRPHGGHFNPDETMRYGSMMTSLGCVFSCLYCHIAGENNDSIAGPIGTYRVKSDERVLDELEIMKQLGIKQVYIEDDSLFGRKKRAIRLLKKMRDTGVAILNVNGVNLIHLLKNYKPDREVLESLIEAGFEEIVLGFESGTQRIIKKYAANKWNVEKSDIAGLINLCKEYGLRIAGNYMLGYPDETREEIFQTISIARHHRLLGLDSANFMLVIPLPGTPLFEMALKEGYLPSNFSTSKMNWTKANLMNIHVLPEELEEIRQKAWEELNDHKYREYKTGMNVDKQSI